MRNQRTNNGFLVAFVAIFACIWLGPKYAEWKSSGQEQEMVEVEETTEPIQPPAPPAPPAPVPPVEKPAPPTPPKRIPAPPTKIEWLSWNEALKQHGQNKKPIWVHITATWCGPCQNIEKNIFPSKEIIALSQEFNCVLVDYDQSETWRNYLATGGIASVPVDLFYQNRQAPYGQKVGLPQSIRDYSTHLKKHLK